MSTPCAGQVNKSADEPMNPTLMDKKDSRRTPECDIHAKFIGGDVPLLGPVTESIMPKE